MDVGPGVSASPRAGRGFARGRGRGPGAGVGGHGRGGSARQALRGAQPGGARPASGVSGSGRVPPPALARTPRSPHGHLVPEMGSLVGRNPHRACSVG